MLFSALGVTTDKHTENIMAVNCSFQQIITVPLMAGNIDPSLLKNPGSNQQTQQVGQKNISTLATAFGGSTAGGL